MENLTYSFTEQFFAQCEDCGIVKPELEIIGKNYEIRCPECGSVLCMLIKKDALK